MTDTAARESQTRESIERLVTQGETAKAEAMKTVGSYRVEQMWSMSTSLETMAIGEFAQDLLDRAENGAEKGKTWTEMLQYTETSLTRQLVDGQFESNSTSSLSNALHACKRDGARRFLRTVSDLLTWIETS